MTGKQFTHPQTQFAGGITMMGPEHLMYITSFVEFGQMVLGEIFESFFPNMGVVAILVM